MLGPVEIDKVVGYPHHNPAFLGEVVRITRDKNNYRTVNSLANYIENNEYMFTAKEGDIYFRTPKESKAATVIGWHEHPTILNVGQLLGILMPPKWFVEINSNVDRDLSAFFTVMAGTTLYANTYIQSYVYPSVSSDASAFSSGNHILTAANAESRGYVRVPYELFLIYMEYIKGLDLYPDTPYMLIPRSILKELVGNVCVTWLNVIHAFLRMTPYNSSVVKVPVPFIDKAKLVASSKQEAMLLYCFKDIPVITPNSIPSCSYSSSKENEIWSKHGLLIGKLSDDGTALELNPDLQYRGEVGVVGSRRLVFSI